MPFTYHLHTVVVYNWSTNFCWTRILKVLFSYTVLFPNPFWVHKENFKSLIFAQAMLFEKFKNKTPLNITHYTVSDFPVMVYHMCIKFCGLIFRILTGKKILGPLFSWGFIFVDMAYLDYCCITKLVMTYKIYTPQKFLYV